MRKMLCTFNTWICYDWQIAEGVVPKLVSSSNDRSIKVWDVETGDCISTLSGSVGHSSPISTCSVFGDVKPIVTSASQGDIRVGTMFLFVSSTAFDYIKGDRCVF
jgi:WD40 repeat protein